MRIKIKKSPHRNAWYMRDYLAGRTCEVLAVIKEKTGKTYFVLHPITKKPGYYIAEDKCEVVEKSKVPTWKQFLRNNEYGYSEYKGIGNGIVVSQRNKKLLLWA